MCEQLPSWLQYLIPVIVLIVEAYLGKTTITKSGSMLELIYNIVFKLVKYRKGKQDEQDV